MVSLCVLGSTAVSLTNHITQIKAEIEDTHGVGVVSSNMMVALFLVSNGADMHVKDLRGNSPLGLCAQDTCALLKEYSEKRYLV